MLKQTPSLKMSSNQDAFEPIAIGDDLFAELANLDGGITCLIDEALSTLFPTYPFEESKRIQSSYRTLPLQSSHHPVASAFPASKENHMPDAGKDELKKVQSESSTKKIVSASALRMNLNWTEKFDQLVKFQQVHGHCNVPTHWPQNPALAQWVKRQRYQYKLKHELGQHSTLNDEREAMLVGIGFSWDYHCLLWEERLGELRQFKEKHGHASVPTRYPDNPQLAIWAKVQRRQYNLFRAGGTKNRKSNINLERISKLLKVGFVFNPRDLKKKRAKKTNSISYEARNIRRRNALVSRDLYQHQVECTN